VGRAFALAPEVSWGPLSGGSVRPRAAREAVEGEGVESREENWV